MKPNTETRPLDYDVMVVGAGVAGMETAASMGDMGYRVLLVDKDASIGGRAILLSKVFPTLDCASCIVTPKMASVSHHPNVQIMTYSGSIALCATPTARSLSICIRRRLTLILMLARDAASVKRFARSRYPISTTTVWSHAGWRIFLFRRPSPKRR